MTTRELLMRLATYWFIAWSVGGGLLVLIAGLSGLVQLIA